jgi:hypothetical protein
MKILVKKFFLIRTPNRIPDRSNIVTRILLNSLLFLIFTKPVLNANLVINEFATGTESDWVELCLIDSEKKKMDISGLFVTMYYGTNEKLGQEPISIYSYDRPETPYDDRFVVVHLTQPNIADETDRTGDTNGNGYIDVYCNNYSGSLWNTEGVIAIDNDDDPANGGIADFVYYSNRDGNPNGTITSYVTIAQNFNQWSRYAGGSIQECAVSIGQNGLESYMSVSRQNQADTNSANDFSVTTVQTPGKQNIILPIIMGGRIFKPLRNKITIIPGHGIFGKGEIPLFIYTTCFIKFRIFSITGIILHESPLYPAIHPGVFNLYWNPVLQRSKHPTGLYLCKVEAVNPGTRKSEEAVVYLIVSRYR